MIQIGSKVWITDDLMMAEEGQTPTEHSKLYFDGALVGGVSNLSMVYDAQEGKSIRSCLIYLKEEDDVTIIDKVTSELVNHGFIVEVNWLFGDSKRKSTYLKKGEVVTDVSTPRLM